ncbi:hypothetical protein GF369_03700 [Candidatus Peregrinibacteria bacterium]|nr:hypothetical protein [Candidatus Peregrinibacteria bacterium]
MKKIYTKLISVIAFAALLITQNSAVFAAANPFTVEAYGIDTIAGYTAHIYSSKTLPGKTVHFYVEKPNGNTLSIPVESDETGVAEFDLYDYHTKKAGTYSVSAQLEGGKEGPTNTFYVFPDEISSMESTVEASSLLATANGIDKIYITITLSDKHGNPIKGHEVEVVSSRMADSVQRISEQQFTDKNGEIIFCVSSDKEGVAIYSFLDTTANTVLDKRLEIAYSLPSNVGGFVPTAYAAAGEVERFIFEDLPASITANADVGFSLTAVDSEGDAVPNYAGTVHFSAEGTNSVYASLPNDYTFDVDLDSGSHNFSGVQSLNFAQEGIYTIVATDLDDFTIRGETEITVGASSTQHQDDDTPDTEGSTDSLAITSPTSGTYSSNELVINGTAPLVGATIQIFDNDTNIGSAEVDTDNTFSYEPSIVVEGEHTFFVVMQDEDGTILDTSDDVTISIDTSPPVVENIEFSPSSGIQTGDIIDIIVTSEPTVFQGAVVFDVDIAELEQDATDETKYVASIQAPSEPGTYPLDVILVDELGNEGAYEDIATIEIDDDGGTTINGDAENEPMEDEDTEQEENEAPSDVFGVKATSSDKKVTLSWQPSTDDSAVDHYTIFYGLTPANLTQQVDTFDNRTTWYIPELTNGNEYFFSIVAVDDEGMESENMSSIISAIPFSPAPVFVPPEPQPQPVTDVQYKPVAPTMQSTGPEEVWFVLLSLVLAQLYFKFKKKVC